MAYTITETLKTLDESGFIPIETYNNLNLNINDKNF